MAHRTCNANTEVFDKEHGVNGWLKSEPNKSSRLRLGSFATAEQAAMACGEAARRLYGPDAYLDLSHMRANFNPLNLNKPSIFSNSTGLLNLRAQPNIHVIYQRIQELKRIDAATASSSSSISDPKNDIQNNTKQPCLTFPKVEERKEVKERKSTSHHEIK